MATTFYANKMKKNDSNFAAHNASDEHNLRLQKDNPNHDPTLSHLNFYQIFNFETGDMEQVQNPTKEHLESLRRYQNHVLNSYKKTFNTTRKNEKDRKTRSNTISAFRAWLDSDKTHELEKPLYREVLKKIEDGQDIDLNEVMDSFQKIAESLQEQSLKISRFGDKRKRLQTATTLQKNKDRRKIRSTKKQTEVLFKIPDNNKITLTSEELLTSVKAWKSYFPDFQMLYIACHHDEDPENPHVHFAISNYNNRTQEFDLYEQEHEALRTFYKKKHKGKPLPAYLQKERKNLTDQERSDWGSLEQDFYFTIINYATKKKYEIRKRTEEEIKQANHQYQKNKAITKREHNRQNKIKEQNKRKKQELKALEEEKIRKQEEIEKMEEQIEEMKERFNEILDKYQEEEILFKDRFMSFLSVLGSIFKNILSKEQDKQSINQRDIELKNRLIFECDFTTEEASRVINAKKEILFEVASEIQDEHTKKLTSKLDKAREALGKVEVSDKRGLEKKLK